MKNNVKFSQMGIFKICEDLNIYVITVGRHTYFTNVFCDLTSIQQQDFKIHGKRINKDGYNQGGYNVALVVESWLSCIYLDMPLSNTDILINKYKNHYIYKNI